MKKKATETGMTSRLATDLEKDSLGPHVQRFSDAKQTQADAIKIVNHLVLTFAGPGYVLNINKEGVWEFVPAPPEPQAQVIPMDIQAKIQEAADAAVEEQSK